MDKWPIIRDMILFFGGLAGVANEAIFQNAERPTLLLLYAAMMGLPAFLRADDKNGNGKK
jgi:hypothetical protein